MYGGERGYSRVGKPVLSPICFAGEKGNDGGGVVVLQSAGDCPSDGFRSYCFRTVVQNVEAIPGL